MCYSTGEHECTYVHMSFLSVCLLLQTDEPDVINSLLTTEIIPLCLGIMESGSELSKTVSAMTQTGPS